MASDGKKTIAEIVVEAVFNILKEAHGQKMTARELAHRILDKYPDYEQYFKNRKDNTIQSIVREIGSDTKKLKELHREIKTKEGMRSRLYYYSEKQDDENGEIQHQQVFSSEDSVSGGNRQLEKELYPDVIQYLYSKLGVFSMRIQETGNTGRGSRANHWLYPDIVGAEDLANDWMKDLKECAYKSNPEKHNSEKLKLWSLEVKQEIGNDLRAYFFQTVANSSWANYAYLATTGFIGNRAEEIEKDLRILCNLHGIGCVIINQDDVTNSQILVPAREREVDWSMANRLANNSAPFRDYINLITQFYNGGYNSKLKEIDWGIKISKEG